MRRHNDQESQQSVEEVVNGKEKTPASRSRSLWEVAGRLQDSEERTHPQCNYRMSCVWCGWWPTRGVDIYSGVAFDSCNQGSVLSIGSRFASIGWVDVVVHKIHM